MKLGTAPAKALYFRENVTTQTDTDFFCLVLTEAHRLEALSPPQRPLLFFLMGWEMARG